MRYLLIKEASCGPKDKQPQYVIAILAVLLCLAASCTDSRELKRERAAEMIANSKDFRAPILLPLKREIDWIVRAQSEEETEAEARARGIEKYYQVNSQMAVLKQLGLIDVRTTLKERPEVYDRTWSFTIEPFLLVRGESLVSSEQGDLPVIPLARKELIEVTGIAKTSDTVAQVQYAWKEVPTEVGRAFISGSPEYQKLPPSLQQTLSGRNQLKDYGKTKHGTAVFMLYDDGWRLAAVQ